MPAALQRFEDGDGGLTDDQVAALVRALGSPAPHEIAPAAPRPLLDLGLPGAVIFLLGGAIPAIAALVFVIDALRYINAETAVAEVIGFEPRTRVVEPQRGERYTVETIAPLLRFFDPERGEVTVAWRDTLPDEASFTQGERLRVFFPRGAPERVEASPEDIVMRPLFAMLLATPLIGMGLASLRHWRQRRG